MKKLNKFFAVFCAAVAAIAFAGCGGGISKATLTYPDYPNADPTKDSWTQWEEEDKVTIIGTSIWQVGAIILVP